MRDKLPERRPNRTRQLTIDWGGRPKHVLVTFGFNQKKRISEVFCADFKVGTEAHAIVVDACILLSRLFQHGDTPKEVAAALGEGSLIKSIATAAAEEDEK
jgi:hypothetical protein